MERYRSVFISDVHLGTKDCRVELLLDFLRNTECDTLFLVGDILDFWQMKRNWFWPETHSTVIQKLLRKSRHGTRVVYIEGNHDPVSAFLGKFLESGAVHFGGLEINREWEYRSLDGRRFLVLHGDQFDLCMQSAPWLTRFGDWGYSVLLRLNVVLGLLNRMIGRTTRWSLSRAIKKRVKKVTRFIGEYESILARVARDRGMDGIICGHIHSPSIGLYQGAHYMNSGDWVEHGSALVEHVDGRFEIVYWAGKEEETRTREAVGSLAGRS